MPPSSSAPSTSINSWWRAPRYVLLLKFTPWSTRSHWPTGLMRHPHRLRNVGVEASLFVSWPRVKESGVADQAAVESIHFGVMCRLHLPGELELRLEGGELLVLKKQRYVTSSSLLPQKVSLPYRNPGGGRTQTTKYQSTQTTCARRQMADVTTHSPGDGRSWRKHHYMCNGHSKCY